MHQGCTPRELDGFESPLLRGVCQRLNLVPGILLDTPHEENVRGCGVTISDRFVEVTGKLRLSLGLVGSVDRAMTPTVRNIVVIAPHCRSIPLPKTACDLTIQLGRCLCHAVFFPRDSSSSRTYSFRSVQLGDQESAPRGRACHRGAVIVHRGALCIDPALKGPVGNRARVLRSPDDQDVALIVVHGPISENAPNVPRPDTSGCVASKTTCQVCPASQVRVPWSLGRSGPCIARATHPAEHQRRVSIYPPLEMLYLGALRRGHAPCFHLGP